MPTRTRTTLALEAARTNRSQLVLLGEEARAARLRRRLTQARLGERVGLSQSAISRAERGLGGGLTLDAWQRIATAMAIPLRVQLQKDPQQEPQDAGHLGIQELVLRLGRRAGYGGLFELPTKPAEPWRSIDVGLADDQRRRLLVVECWNTIWRRWRELPHLHPEACRGRRARHAPLGRPAPRDGPRLGRPRHREEPRARRPLPGGLRRALPRQQSRLGARAARRSAATQRVRPGLGERRRHADLPLAAKMRA